MNILLTGGSGNLGTELKKILPNCIAPTKQELDITNRNQVFDFFKNNSIDVVIHTAAITKIRFCEENQRITWDTNVQGTRNIVDAIKKSEDNTKFVYISTACVFDGHRGMYKESDVPYPENFYALTKLVAESEVTKVSNHLIIRTNFVAKKPWPYPAAFTDRFGTYLFAENVAKGIKDILDEDLNEIVHLVGDKKISMFELAQITSPDIKPMTINDYQGPPLTMDMSLDTEKWKKYSLTRN
ncbi:sugar nucleotide-binding protein [Nitrosopumilus sp. b2]|uniref:SDR family oxidoreductase n=1 Tax=Nitrosopumilus sp. b2 TaxID=2109908 RepID=UPI0015F4903A|nr:sugar nucleotide-binding protein [Nitrosopumilus sp. b2]KAF6245770.1 NAD(P)-dependent oxidoreductase [Nitrosopumilus sp. b2]